MTIKPGRYRSADILTDNAKLDGETRIVMLSVRIRLDKPIKKRAKIIQAGLVCKNSELHGHKHPTIIEKAKHENGVQTLAERKKHQEPIWSTSATINGAGKEEGNYIQYSIYLLCHWYITTRVRDFVQ